LRDKHARRTRRFLTPFLPALACLFVLQGYAQSSYTAFTVNDGLPSNNVYRCLEDKKGFLWVATDAGVARFDGKHFQVFTTKEGLPDNEVLSVAMERDGRIWVNCFKQSPAYFDDVKNRFINASEDSNLAIASGTSLMSLYTLPDGGVMYINEKASYFFKDRKPVHYKSLRQDLMLIVQRNADGSLIGLGGIGWGPKKGGLKLVHHGMAGNIDSVYLGWGPGSIVLPSIDNGNLYIVNSAENRLIVLSNMRVNPLRFDTASVVTPGPSYHFSFSGRSIYFLANDGRVYVYDKKTLQPRGAFGGDYLPNSFFDDSRGNTWVATIDKGLLLYRKKAFGKVVFPDTFTRVNFLSVAVKPDGTVLAGNFYGEIVERTATQMRVHKLWKKIPSRQRKIILSGNDVYSFSEDGISINFGKALMNPGTRRPYPAKTAILLNDSTIFVGTGSGLYQLNTRTGLIFRLNAVERVTSLAGSPQGLVYFGSTDGLHRFNPRTNTCAPFADEQALRGERITSLCFTPDGLLWVGTASKGVVVLRDGRLAGVVNQNAGLTNNVCRTLTAGLPGQVWLGSEQGLAAVRYRTVNGVLTFTVQKITASDGLESNSINEIVFHHDSIYAATTNGISIIPANIAITSYAIPVELAGARVNEELVPLSGHFDLPYGRQNIQLLFSGIELNGHFRNLQYTLDAPGPWIDMGQNTLNLQLTTGSHVLRVRGVDVNGNGSRLVREVTFTVATPFWKRPWFWIVAGLLAQLLVLYAIFRYLKQRRRSKLAKEVTRVQTAALEQQALTSLMNPHFLFNALNGIQHYINVQDRQNANRYLSNFASLIRKNFDAAQRSFITLEQEIENIGIYLQLEKMRFGDRFAYEIDIAEETDMDQMIPTMMLQPLLENAILHGLMPSAQRGFLLVRIYEEAECLVISIRDNGIGVEKSLSAKQGYGHQSRGMELIKKRVAALAHFVPQSISLHVAPAFAGDENPGTEITIKLPFTLHSAWRQAQQSTSVSISS
jgi:ligand-binding sensor domain-containing protein/signal transduction histidine kinase